MIGEPPPRSLNVNTAVVSLFLSPARVVSQTNAHDKHPALVHAATWPGKPQ
jgi:hypothetical protein